MCWAVGWLVGWLAGRLVGRLVSYLFCLAKLAGSEPTTRTVWPLLPLSAGDPAADPNELAVAAAAAAAAMAVAAASPACTLRSPEPPPPSSRLPGGMPRSASRRALLSVYMAARWAATLECMRRLW